ncbi:hypothetical protein [Microbispora rosea]|uniref:hypothetical protein n=1 Tax=Microbispora rosea TaxID=58117 RepID=UPI00341A42A9
MRATTQSIVFGSALLTVLGIGSPAARAVPVFHAVNPLTVAAPHNVADDDSPYQQGYEKGTPEGYSAGEAQAYNKCEYAFPSTGTATDAYGHGYSDAYGKAYDTGYQQGLTKYCTPR